MARPADGIAYDAFAWGLNIGSALCIIFVNKQLMSPGGYFFCFATTLTAVHFLVSALYLKVAAALKGSRDSSNVDGEPRKPTAEVPLTELLLFTATANTSVIGLNLSLMYNTVGFYQMTKLLIAPFVCLIEYVWLGRRFSPAQVTAIGLVVLGVGVVSVSGDTAVNGMVGLVAAVLAVAGTGMQQVLVRQLQQRHGVNSEQLLGKTAPLQGGTLMLLGPLLDRYLTGLWVFGYEWPGASPMWFSGSCLAAIGINLSQYMVLGRFSAATYSVVGHVKTVLVLTGGWAFFGENMTTKQLLGMAAAVAGMVWYGRECEVQGRTPSQPLSVPTTLESPLADSERAAFLGAKANTK